MATDARSELGLALNKFLTLLRQAQPMPTTPPVLSITMAPPDLARKGWTRPASHV